MVKRYTLSCPDPDGFAVEPFDADLLKPTVIVRGSDYDALAARLAALEAAARNALHYMRLHKYADQSWADDLERALGTADSAAPREDDRE